MQYNSMSVRAGVEEVSGESFFLAEELNEQLADTDIAFVSELYGKMYVVQLFDEFDEGEWKIRTEFTPESDRFHDEIDRLAKELDAGTLILDWPGRENRYLIEVGEDE